MEKDPKDLTWQDILNAVNEGRNAIFVDDGGAGNHTLDPDILVQDFLLFVALQLSKQQCHRVEAEHDEWIESASKHAGQPVSELHATDLVNPKPKSVWRNVSIEIRSALLREAYERFCPHIPLIYVIYIGGEQYRELMNEARAQAPNSGDIGHRSYRRQDDGLERTMWKCLIREISKSGIQSVIIADARKKYDSHMVQMFEPDVPVWNRSVFYGPSSKLMGLQLADLVAWTLNRRYVIENRVKHGGELMKWDEHVLWALYGWTVFGTTKHLLDSPAP